MEVFESLKANLVGKNARIVLPEGEEPRILQATKRLVKETEVIPVLLGNPTWAWLTVWYLVRFTQLPQQFAQPFKSLKLVQT